MTGLLVTPSAQPARRGGRKLPLAKTFGVAAAEADPVEFEEVRSDLGYITQTGRSSAAMQFSSIIRHTLQSVRN